MQTMVQLGAQSGEEQGGAPARVLALLTDGFGASGGIAQYNRDLLTALSETPAIGGIVVLPRFGDAAAVRPAKIVQLTAMPGRVAWIAQSLRLAMQRHFDVIFCGHLNAAPLAALIARLTRTPLWLQVHGIEAWARPGRAVRAATQQADLVTAVSRFTRQKLLTWSDIDPARVRVLPNTFEARQACSETPVDVIARHGLAGRKVILTVGRLASGERYKGHDRIIKALSEVRGQCPQAIYLVAGSGDDQPRLEALAAAVGVREHVVFAGQVPPDELQDYFQLANVFAMPSTGEGFGIVFLEAAASGLPIVAGNRDGSTDALADGALGTLIDPEDQAALVTALVDRLRQKRPSSPPAAIQRFAFANFASQVGKLVRNHD